MSASNLSTSRSSSPWEDEATFVQRLLLEEADCRLVTLVGLGHICKTWLAWQATTRVRDAFADGACVIRLLATTPPGGLARAIARELGCPPPEGADPEAHLVESLRDREMLLTLDGFEHLVEGADLIEDVLSSAPGIKWLVTSRARLGLHAEWVRQIGWESAPFARETGQRSNLAPWSGMPAWGRTYAHTGHGWIRNGESPRQRLLDTLAQTP